MFDRLDRLRRFRRPRPYWMLSAVAALVAALITASVVQRAESTLSAYGTRTTVAVAASDLAVGHAVTTDDVVWQDVPTVLANGTASVDPVGRTVVHPILDGELLVDERLAPGGLSPTQSLIGADRRALVVDAPDDLGPFAPGDQVDLLAARFDGGRASWVARDATVVALGESTITVAVDEGDAPEAARAALDGTIVLALIGEPG